MEEQAVITALRKLLDEPTRETYLEVVKAAAATPEYNPDSLEVIEVDGLCEDGEFYKALEKFVALANAWITSPRMHTLAGVAYQQLGDSESGAFELRFANALITAMLKTGKGTVLSPYVVTRLSDEYDLLDYLSSEDGQVTSSPRVGMERQLQRMTDGRWLDYHRLSDGSGIWFDNTRAMARPGNKGVLRSGDGREAYPFKPTSLREEYQVPRYLLKGMPQQQRLESRDDRHFHVQQYANGSELWFDVTSFQRPT